MLTVEDVSSHGLEKLITTVTLFSAEAVQHDVHTIRGDPG